MTKPGPKERTKTGARIITLLAKGKKVREIAEAVGVATQTVSYYKRVYGGRKGK